MSIRVRIVTPERVAFEGRAEHLQAPGYLGEFGILPHHERFLTLARPGRVLIRTEEGELGFVVGPGFAEAGPAHLTLLTDHCEPFESVDTEAAARQLREAESRLLESRAGTPDWDAAEREAELARARLAV